MAQRSPQKVNQRLEHYVFSMAGHLIDSVDPPTQQALIDAASRFIAIADTDAADAVLPDEAAPATDPAPDRRFAHQAWLASWVQQQREYQQQRIVCLEKALLVTQQRYQLVQDTVLREPYRSRLLHRCQRSLDHFQQCLDSAYTMTRSSAEWLNRLQYGKAV